MQPNLVFARLFIGIVLIFSSIISVNAIPPIERVKNPPPVMLDENNNSITCFVHSCEILTNERVIIQSTLTNLQDKFQKFVYLVQIKDHEGITASLSWVTGKLEKKGVTNVTQSWIPDRISHYIVETFVWESLEDAVALSPIPNLSVMVLPDQQTKFQPVSNNPMEEPVIGPDGISHATLKSQESLGGGWGGFSKGSTIILHVNSTKSVYADISHFDIEKQEWIMQKYAFTDKVRMEVMIPDHLLIPKWMVYVRNPNYDVVNIDMLAYVKYGNGKIR